MSLLSSSAACRWGISLCCMAAFCLPSAASAAPRSSFARVIDSVQPHIVKIYGAGGIRGLEAYQSGFLISSNGHILTVWSTVLDTDYITAVLDDGRKFEAQLIGADPRFDIAVLKIDSQDLPHFNLDQSPALSPSSRVLAFSNLYNVAAGDEAASVLHGQVAAVTNLSARRGAFQSNYRGKVYVLDAMTNNPGAAGGALTDRQGKIAGVLGKEMRNSLNNTWLNFAIPISELNIAIEDILAGRRRRIAEEEDQKPEHPHALAGLGLVLVPDVLSKTPPFIEQVLPESSAAKAGLRPDDLILFVEERVVSSCQGLREELSYIDKIDPVRLTVQRGQELLTMTLEGLR